MDRGDVLAKLQSTTSHSANETLSITDAAIQSNTDTKSTTLNALDSQSVFKLISSANDLDHQQQPHQQRFEFDKMAECTKQAIINKFLSTAAAAAAAAATSPITSMQSSNNDNHNTMMYGSSAQLFDTQTTATKNKRKNFKPRNATAIDTEPSISDQILLMMQNKMKQFQQQERSTDDDDDDNNDNDDNNKNDSSSNSSDSEVTPNHSANSLKSPPNSPTDDGQDDTFKMNLLRSLQQRNPHSHQSLAAIYSQFADLLPMLPITSQSTTDYATDGLTISPNDAVDTFTKRIDNGKYLAFIFFFYYFFFLLFLFFVFLIYCRDDSFFFILFEIDRHQSSNRYHYIFFVQKLAPCCYFPMVFESEE